VPAVTLVALEKLFDICENFKILIFLRTEAISVILKVL
jgi:hypothetical protein